MLYIIHYLVCVCVCLVVMWFYLVGVYMVVSLCRVTGIMSSVYVNLCIPVCD